MNKKLTFKATTKELHNIVPAPKPAKNYLPKWWKDAWTFGRVVDEKKLQLTNGTTNSTFKKCQPILDSLTHGYIIELPFDIYLEQDEGNEDGFKISWKVDAGIFTTHGQHAMNMETPHGYHKRILKYQWPIVPYTPEGFSLLVVEPLGYNQLPFKAVPAIVDTDDKRTTNFAIPCWPSTSFDGIVKAGTPIAQLIPIKRENWTSDYTYYEDGEYDAIETTNFRKHILNHYVNRIWKKKKFN